MKLDSVQCNVIKAEDLDPLFAFYTEHVPAEGDVLTVPKTGNVPGNLLKLRIISREFAIKRSPVESWQVDRVRLFVEVL